MKTIEDLYHDTGKIQPKFSDVFFQAAKEARRTGEEVNYRVCLDGDANVILPEDQIVAVTTPGGPTLNVAVFVNRQTLEIVDAREVKTYMHGGHCEDLNDKVALRRAVEAV